MKSFYDLLNEEDKLVGMINRCESAIQFENEYIEKNWEVEKDQSIDLSEAESPKELDCFKKHNEHIHELVLESVQRCHNEIAEQEEAKAILIEQHNKAMAEIGKFVAKAIELANKE